MNALKPWNRATVAVALAVLAFNPLAVAQTAPAASSDPAKPEEAVKLEKFIVTGSSIKRPADEGALPISVFTKLDLEQEGIASAEQLIMSLNINGNSADNLASNADVVTGQQRGNNGATSANLRLQGSNATLILLNGRRVSSHGLNGGVVDLNQIPFQGIERVEVLKDGASAVYGTDAIGGVINFITKSDFQGLVANAATDITEDGGGNIYRYSLVGGWGDLNADKWNVMASLSLSEHEVLRGVDRDFVNTFQPARGLSPDTRGAPVATIFAISSVFNILSRDNINAAGRGAGPIDPADPAATLRVNGINIVDLPTNTQGYASFPDMGPYDHILWNSPAAKYGSAWDTGRAAVLQQPVKNTNFVGRGSFKLGKHLLTAEAVIGRSESDKSFSANQITSSTASTNPFFNLAYPSTGSDYGRVYNALAAFFPAASLNNGAPIPFRWRAIPMGNRELRTVSDTNRFLLGLEGPLPLPGDYFSEWEYRAGLSRAESKSKSRLNRGYFYAFPFAALINNGTVNPFSYTQTAQALTALDGVRADGAELYGGTFTTTQADFTATGPVARLFDRTIQGAIGFDFRREEYFFAGDPRSDPSSVTNFIFNAPFDNALATAGTLERDIKAVFAEVQIPVMNNLDLNVAARRDHYTGFGSSTNPKLTLRYVPHEKVLFRSSYSTGFRVPTFKQQFDPLTQATYSGLDLVDPVTNLPIPANTIQIYSGGKASLNPEEAKMYSFGLVVSPVKNITLSADWWSVNRDGTILILGPNVILTNAGLFADSILRNTGNTIVAVDNRWLNAGETTTKGIEYSARGDFSVFGGKLVADLNVTQLLEKKSRLIASAPFGRSEIGRFTRASDLGLKWKYTTSVSFRKDKWTARLSQLYRAGYMDSGAPPGALTIPGFNPKVDEYITYNASFTYRWNKDLNIVAGIKNLFNEEPPFTASAYDSNTGGGGSWEPRVADPRGRAFTLSVEYKIF